MKTLPAVPAEDDQESWRESWSMEPGVETELSREEGKRERSEEVLFSTSLSC